MLGDLAQGFAISGVFKHMALRLGLQILGEEIRSGGSQILKAQIHFTIKGGAAIQQIKQAR
ncbi:hypothetical protein JCM17844_12530 [Iodidimonas gelatinilytica]|uniref:Uncharacterized protein n=1 Tax=Iodidimonas gelatinilytica TaxID=1236966 RepID=A0A5A7MP30_9PROT|nr:hypothetical protein JCM17844_12530 [Iodidimonas gelatinilytica]